MGYVMKFQVEKDIEALRDEAANQIGAGSGEQFLAHLDAAFTRIKLPRHGPCRSAVRIIQGDDNSCAGCHSSLLSGSKLSQRPHAGQRQKNWRALKPQPVQ